MPSHAGDRRVGVAHALWGVRVTSPIELLRLQGEWCTRLGSPLYGALLAAAADDAVAGGPVADVLEGYPYEPVASAMALRLMGAVHRLVLAGDAPALAAHYPSAGGDGDAARAWPVFRAVVEERRAWLRERMHDGVQTNEVGRSAALLPGFLTVARDTGLPLRCLEVGTSGGLNLRWDRFRYEAGTRAWGDPASEVVLHDAFAVGPLPFDDAARVEERAGCDPSPVDPTTDAGLLTLCAYVWPDQLARLALLRAAARVARRVPATIVRATAGEWLEDALACPRAGVATIVFHSIVLQYLAQADRDRMRTALEAAGARATREAPVAWLSMEPGGAQAEVRLTIWPGGTKRLVATTSFHGRDVACVSAA
jgi:hypothetical protein